MRKLTIEEVRERAYKRGFKLISDVYISSSTKMTWQCLENGHYTDKKFNDVDQGKGCLACAGSEPHTIEKVRQRGLELGFTLLSTEYTGCMSTLIWNCRQGHTVRKSYNNIDRGSQCIECSGHKKLTLETVRAKGIELGFTLLSTEYINNKSPLIWLCSKNHLSKKSFNSINTGCKACTVRFQKSQKELYQYVKNIFNDALFDKRGLLKSRRLELDIYIPSLKKAIELDGEYWHSLPSVVERDARKDKECQEAGIELLRLSYTKHWHKERKELLGKPKVLKFLRGL